MDMTGEYRIPAPRQRVWEALNDPLVLRQAIPGCEQLDKISDQEMTARVKAKVGPVSATFTGKVTLGDLNPPESYTISGEGSGGVAGFAKGGAKVNLADDGADTVLRYEAKADVGGKLAQIGSRLIQGTAKKMADDFFSRFSRIVGEQHAAAAPPVAGSVAPALPRHRSPCRRQRSSRWQHRPRLPSRRLPQPPCPLASAPRLPPAARRPSCPRPRRSPRRQHGPHPRSSSSARPHPLPRRPRRPPRRQPSRACSSSPWSGRRSRS